MVVVAGAPSLPSSSSSVAPVRTDLSRTGIRQVSRWLDFRPGLESPLAQRDGVRPSAHGAVATDTSGTPGCSVKSCAMSVTGRLVAAPSSAQS